MDMELDFAFAEFLSRGLQPTPGHHGSPTRSFKLLNKSSAGVRSGASNLFFPECVLGMDVECEVSFVRVPARAAVVHGGGSYFEETCVSEAHSSCRRMLGVCPCEVTSLSRW